MDSLNNNNLSQKLAGIIESIIESFRTYPDIFLTEEDVRCHLFSKLLNLNINKILFNTKDGSRSIKVHTEIRWYGSSGKLKYRSDIVILEPTDLITRNGGNLKLPSKGFGFNTFSAIIEIKLRRVNGKSDNAFIEETTKAIDKLKQIRDETKASNKHDPVLVILVFDKKNDISRLFNFDDEEVLIKYIFPRNI